MRFLACLALVVASVYAFAAPFEKVALSKTRSAGEATFTPAKLPCAFTINTQIERDVPGSSFSIEEDYHYRGGLFHMVSIIDKTSYSELAVRIDLPFKDQGQEYVPVFSVIPKQKCQKVKMLSSRAQEYIGESWLNLFMIKQTYDGVEDSEFKGKKCKMYYTRRNEQELHVFVDDSNYVIGSWRYNGDRTDTTSMSYVFSAPLDWFAMNRTKVSDCDSKAYSVPKDQC